MSEVKEYVKKLAGGGGEGVKLLTRHAGLLESENEQITP